MTKGRERTRERSNGDEAMKRKRYGEREAKNCTVGDLCVVCACTCVRERTKKRENEREGACARARGREKGKKGKGMKGEGGSENEMVGEK